MTDCPCGSNKELENCCEKFISGKILPETPEELMRSRYTAYTQHNISYIENTMGAPANENFEPEETRDWLQHVNWLKLEVLNRSVANDKGTVEFCAHFMFENKKHLMHEISQFTKINGKWFYVSGVAPKTLKQANTKINRNEICPCGSHKKFKKCCGSVAS